MDSPFSIDESIRFGWNTLRSHSGIVFQAVLTLFGVEVAYAVVSRVLSGTLLGILTELVLVIIAIVTSAGLTRILIQLARSEPTTYSDLFPSITIVFNYFLASLLSGVLILLPFVVCVILALLTSLLPSAVALVPIIVEVVVGIVASGYLFLRYFFVKFAAVDGASITGSLHRSALMTVGEKRHLILFCLAILGINLLGLIVLIVGLVVSIPVSLLAMSYVYQRLLRVEAKA